MEGTYNAVYRLLTGGDFMKSVSNAFKLSCDNDVIDSDFLVYVSKGKDGNVLCTLDNTDFIIQTMRLRGSSTSEQTISIGGVCSTEFTLTLTKNGVDKLQSSNSFKKNYCLHVVQWNKVDDENQSSESHIYNVDGSLNTTGRCDLGYYYISKIKNSDYDCVITAYDGMLRFDKAIGANVLKYMKKNKKTISGWLDYFCTKLNNSYFSFSYSVSSKIVNDNLEVCISDDSEVDTYRQALGYLSALACGFATFTNSGDLIIQTYNTDISVESINDKRLYDYDFDSYVSKVTSFSSSVAGFDFSLNYTGDKNNSEEIDIEVSENPFLRGLQKYNSDTLDSRIDTALTNIATSILGVCFYGCNVDVVQRPYLDLGDMVDVQRVVVNEDGSLSSVNTTNIIVCSYDYAFCSSMSLTSSGATGTSTSSSSGKLSSSPKEKPSSTDSRVDELINDTTLTKKVKKRVPVNFTIVKGIREVDLFNGEVGLDYELYYVDYNINKGYFGNSIDDLSTYEANSLFNYGSGFFVSGITLEGFSIYDVELKGFISDKSKPRLIIDSNDFRETSYIMRDYIIERDIHDKFYESSINESVSIIGTDFNGNITELNSIVRDLFGRVLSKDSDGNLIYLDSYTLDGDYCFESEWHVVGNEKNFQTANKKLKTSLTMNSYGFRLNYGKIVGDDIEDLYKDIKDNYIDDTSMYIDLTNLDFHNIESLSFGYKNLKEVSKVVDDKNNYYYENSFISQSLTDNFSYDGYDFSERQNKDGYSSIVNDIVVSYDSVDTFSMEVPFLKFSRERSIDDIINFEGRPLLYLEYEEEEEYEKTISGVSQKLNDVSDKADKNESDIESIKSDLSSMTSNVSSLKSTVTSLKDKVSSLNTSVSGIKTDISTITSELSGIVAKDYDTKLSSINTNIREINSSIESINTSLSETDTLLSSLNTSVSNQSTTISNLSNLVSSQAETIAELTNKITDLESEIANIKPSSSINVLTFSNESDVSIGTNDVEVLSCDIDADAGTKLLVNLSFVGNFNLNDVLLIKLVIDGVESSFVPKFQVFSGYCSYSISKSVLTTSSSRTSNLTIFASLLNSSGSFSSENFEVNILKSSSGSTPPYSPNLEYSEDVGLVSVGVSEPINIQSVDSSVNISFV